jgi:hypothetical protein
VCQRGRSLAVDDGKGRHQPAGRRRIYPSASDQLSPSWWADEFRDDAGEFARLFEMCEVPTSFEDDQAGFVDLLMNLP